VDLRSRQRQCRRLAEGRVGPCVPRLARPRIRPLPSQTRWAPSMRGPSRS